MSSPLLAVVGLAGVGLFLATRNRVSPPAEPAEELPDGTTVEEPAIQFPEDEPEEPETQELPIPPEPPAGPGNPPSGSGEPEVPESDPWVEEKLDQLPSYLQGVNLSGNELYKYIGHETIKDKLCLSDPPNSPFKCRDRLFDTWLILDSLNGLTIKVFVERVNPINFLSVFMHPDRLTIHKMRGTTQRDRDWLSFNILGKPRNSFLQDVLF